LAGALDAIVGEHPGQRVLAVCHGGVINVMLAIVLDLDRHLWFEPEYTSISRIVASRAGVRSVTSVNETGHLVGKRERP
jgi:probable phosphoglycerate mutase